MKTMNKIWLKWLNADEWYDPFAIDNIYITLKKK